MRIPRRTFVHTLHGAAMATLATRVTAAQTRLPVINVPELTLIAGASLTMTANASANTVCVVEIDDGDRGVAAAKWGLSANRSDTDRRDKFDGPERRGPRRYHVKITLGQANVSVGVALVQERPDRPGEPRAGVLAPGAPAGPGSTARFVQDPAKDPGNFLVSLPTDCIVALKIWPGEDTSGVAVHTNRFDKVAKGAQGIPWNLQRDGGGRASGGRYTALLVCTPYDPGFLPTNLISYFAVLP